MSTQPPSTPPPGHAADPSAGRPGFPPEPAESPPRPSPEAAAGAPSQAYDHGGQESLGQLVSQIGNDMSQLFRQEVELAKAEIREEASRAGKAAGMLGGAGFAGYMVAVLLSLAAVFGLGALIGLGWSALIVALVWAVIGAVLFTSGRSKLRAVSPKPERTLETMKENAQWARHPTS